MGGWLETDNRAISVQLNLTGTATGTELGNKLGLSKMLIWLMCSGISLFCKLEKSDSEEKR